MSKNKEVTLAAATDDSVSSNGVKAAQKESKRKRRNEEADDESKVSKKSKKAKRDDETAVETEEGTVAEAKKEKKEKKDKKSKKAKDEAEDTTAEITEVEEKKSKKSKKDKKSREKDDAAPIQESTTSVSAAQDFIPLDDEPMPDADVTTPKKDKKKSKKDKKAESAPETNGIEAASEDKDKKKSKKENKAAEQAPAAETNGVDSRVTEVKKEKKSKKDKKASKSEPAAEAETEADAATKEEDAVKGKDARFIIFVGNLPYTATREQIETHFVKVPPKEIRLVTDKKTGKHKGIAFIEFDKFDKMKTCLKKYHHSVFPDPKNKAGRKINIELTAGGGGNSSARKDKIAAKNDKLAEERIRDRENRDELEAKQKERADKKAARVKTGKKGDAPVEETPKEAKKEEEHNGIHPARLAMMSGSAGNYGSHQRRY